MNVFLNKNVVYFFKLCLLIFVILDVFFLFNTYLGHTLDGDMPTNVLLSKDLIKIFSDPLGINALLNNECYLGTNRYFAHLLEYKLLTFGPILCQKFITPIESVYVACALVKTFTHIILIYLISIVLTGKFSPINLKNIFSFCLLSCFFQASGGFYSKIGIVDVSPTYTIFYATSLIFVILYFMPLIFFKFHDRVLIPFKYLIIPMILLSIFVSLGGPLNFAVCIVFIFSYVFFTILNNYYNQKSSFSFSKEEIITLVPIFLLSIYSYILSTHNQMGIDYQKPIFEMYNIFFNGLKVQFLEDNTYLFITILLITNVVILLISNTFSKKMKMIFIFLILFSITYIFLLPFGGYRPWRPFILRYDTVIPFNIIIFGMIIGTSIVILNYLKENLKLITLYISFVLYIGVFYLNKDQNQVFNKDEKNMLNTLSTVTSEDTIKFLKPCPLFWSISKYPNTEASELLLKWNITSKKVLYCN